MASITAARDRATAAAVPRLVVIVAGGLVLCLLASISLARRVAAPIDRVSRDIHAMVESIEEAPAVMPEQSIQELDALGASFSTLLQTVHEARAETSAAYLGAIRALVAALDARDPYTAGHSERVSLLSVAIGQAMGLGQDDLDVLRLGALLHDIGKIGISDAILTKPAELSDDEFEAIQRHTSLGAQILRPIAFLAAHVPIVELHHERPDGTGYPHGLCGDAIPIHARIVHVADAFDAMTTARAYRSARPATEAVGELWQHAGTDFDVPSLQGLASVVARMDAAALVALAEPPVDAADGAAAPRPPRVPRRSCRSSAASPESAGACTIGLLDSAHAQPSRQRRGRDDPRRRGGPGGAGAGRGRRLPRARSAGPDRIGRPLRGARGGDGTGTDRAVGRAGAGRDLEDAPAAASHSGWRPASSPG